MNSLLWDMESVALRSILLSCCELRSFTHSNVGELQVCSGRFLLSRAIADPLSFPGHVQKGKFPPETWLQQSLAHTFAEPGVSTYKTFHFPE